MAESFLDGEEEDAVELEAEHKVSLAKWFLLNAPPEEIQQVAKGEASTVYPFCLHMLPSPFWYCCGVLLLMGVLHHHFSSNEPLNDRSSRFCFCDRFRF